MLVYVCSHMLGGQSIPYIPWRSAHRNPLALLSVTIRFHNAALPIINRRRGMQPMRGIFRIFFASLKTDAHPDFVAFTRTRIDSIEKRGYSAMRTVKDTRFVTQAFQFGLYSTNVIAHREGRLCHRRRSIANGNEQVILTYVDLIIPVIRAFVTQQHVLVRLTRKSAFLLCEFQNCVRGHFLMLGMDCKAVHLDREFFFCFSHFPLPDYMSGVLHSIVVCAIQECQAYWLRILFPIRRNQVARDEELNGFHDWYHDSPGKTSR